MHWLTKYTNKKCISLYGTSCMCTLSASAFIEPLLHVHQFEQTHSYMYLTKMDVSPLQAVDQRGLADKLEILEQVIEYQV